MEKRYRVLFTCLTVRAVQVEVTHSLDSSSFINALRRFITKRCLPQVIRSDNGSNLASGETELEKPLADGTKQRLVSFCSKTKCVGCSIHQRRHTWVVSG